MSDWTVRECGCSVDKDGIVRRRGFRHGQPCWHQVGDVIAGSSSKRSNPRKQKSPDEDDEEKGSQQK